ncbi:hypothetical protein [Cryobacterium lyxosi]|uniref:Uncharacterized protein n=1 Tax=Cryobacterium lyxosi TaxID=1259228 RepID=A0A4R8ZIV0_9MICO|nr:hypothetical protein [Cryobacterium lyxosi]TFD29184.1 hypothetical protein E3T27_00165 [Cryobacterium lyxosi]
MTLTRRRDIVVTHTSCPAAFWAGTFVIALALTFSTMSPALALTVRSEDTPSTVTTEPETSPEPTPTEETASTSEPTPTEETVSESPEPTYSDAPDDSATTTPTTTETEPSTDTWTYVAPRTTRRSTTTTTATPTAEPEVVVQVAPTAEPSATPTPQPTQETLITEVDYTSVSSAGASPLAVAALTASLVLAALLGAWALLYKLRLANRPTNGPFRRR